VTEEERRVIALQAAVSWGNGWKSAAPGPSTVLDTAKQFEEYLKGE
jgi:hypothetical protein